MNIEEIRDYCLSLPHATECMPFDDIVLVFKVYNKMFALTNLEGELKINIKCLPERALELREEYSSVIPGFHMNKKHWNTVIMDDSIDDSIIREWIKDSYKLIVSSIPKKIIQTTL